MIEQQSFDTELQEQRYKDLIAELRCLVCQNQNLADSDAPLAKDLRRKTAEMLRAGKSDQEVRAYMRERYGDFVLYRPPFTLSTAILWLGPVIFAITVIVLLVVRIRRRQHDELLAPSQADDQALRTEVQNLLRDAPDIERKP